MSRYELDAGARRIDEGRVVLGGSPLTMFRLGAGGCKVLDLIAAGRPVPPTAEPLVDRLLDAGVIHPIPTPGLGPTAGEVTLVIPAFGADPRELAAVVSATGAGRSLVIDDASPVPIGPVDGAEVVRLDTNVGPGGARECGLSLVTTPFVVFVDADVTAHPDWMSRLLPFFADARTAAVAPRVRADSTSAAPTPLVRFEQARSPLDLGSRRARIRAGTRVSYVPAAALICRVDALRSVGGFENGLRLGEDVDLVWRLDAAHWRCRYEPSVEVFHTVRGDLRAWMNQRAGYGSSAADLAQRHGAAVSPLRLPATSAVAWAAVAAGAPLVGAGVALAAAAPLRERLPEMSERNREAVRLVGLGQLHAGSSIASAMTRTWWPIALVAAIRSTRARRALLAAIVVPALIDWWKVRRSIDPIRFAALRTLDDAAYGFGVWKGALQKRSWAALRPVFTDLDTLRRWISGRRLIADEPGTVGSQR